MNRKITTLAAAALLCLSVGRAAADGPVLVELFTSQACASCPKADAFLHELVAREDVIALALHVDYWDYIFDDPFGKEAHTKRQYGYAGAGGRDMVYTPQMVIGGLDHVVGNRPKDVTRLIDKHLAAPRPVTVELTREGDRVTVSAKAAAGFDAPLLVQIAQFLPEKTVSIDEGENAGKTYSYANIVTDLTEIGRWDPATPLSMSFDAPNSADGDTRLAVVLQRPDYGRVEAAALLR